MNFTADERYRQIAEAFALDAVELAHEKMQITLDWTDQSIQQLESILDVFSKGLPEAKPPDEDVRGFSKMWGSYLGEVFRKNHGATWGLITHNGQSFPGMQSKSGTLFWPWGKIENRIRNGSEDNVWHYYLGLSDQLPKPLER